MCVAVLVDGGKMPPAAASDTRQRALALRSVAEANTANAAAVEQTVNALQQQATERSDDLGVQSALHFARGMLSLARKDVAGAAHTSLSVGRPMRIAAGSLCWRPTRPETRSPHRLLATSSCACM